MAPDDGQVHADESPMSGKTMDQTMDHVVASLRATFPTVPESHVREVVARIHATLDGARVRADVPIHVAREARAAPSPAVIA